MKLNKDKFRENVKGKETSLHLLENAKGMQAAITNYGARIVSLMVEGVNQEMKDVVVGFDSMKGYLSSTETYYSAIVGRYANRIAKGKFAIEGKEYQLAINNPPNHLHGGPSGFHNQVWEIEEQSSNRIRLFYHSKDGEENYPGNLKVSVTYHLTENNGLVIEYEARTDKTTIINLTSHPFFNLNGQGSGTIENHLLEIHADYYNPVDDALIPTGIEPVSGTPFDFTKPKKIGNSINEDNDQLRYGHGYDHNLVLNGSGFRLVAIATGEQSGIVMEVHTDQPGMQLYSGNYMKGENRIKDGQLDRKREAFCLETQHFPDSPNHPDFPSTILHSNEVFQSRTEYRFL